jgi:transketolase
MLYNPDFQSSTQKSFSEAINRLGLKFRNMVVLNSNMSDTTVLQAFNKTFPERVFKFGNEVDTMFAAACGFTVRGKLPLICTYAISTGRSWDLIRNYLCYPNLNVKIIGFRAGLLNSDEGATFQALEDVALMSSIPNMKVLCPADPVETRKALEVMMDDYGPTYMRLTHAPVPDLYDDRYRFEIGRGHIYKPGTDICIFTYGVGLHMAMDAAQLFDRQGVSVMVVNISSIKPIDENLIIECAKAVNRVVTVEDHSINGGLGTAVAEVLSTHYPVKVLRLGVDGFGETGKVDDLFRKYKLNAAGIVESIIEAQDVFS